MKYGRWPCAVLLLAVAAVVAPGAAAQTTTTAPGAPRLDKPLIVVSAPDAAGWVRLLRASGAAARIGTLDEALDRPAALFSGALSLSPDQRGRIRAAVSDGKRAVVAGDALLADVGLQRSADRSVTSARMAGLDGEARWAPSVSVRPLQGASLTPVATSGEAVLVGVTAVGKGQVLALGVDPLAPGRDGHDLLPAG